MFDKKHDSWNNDIMENNSSPQPEHADPQPLQQTASSGNHFFSKNKWKLISIPFGLLLGIALDFLAAWVPDVLNPSVGFGAIVFVMGAIVIWHELLALTFVVCFFIGYKMDLQTQKNMKMPIIHYPLVIELPGLIIGLLVGDYIGGVIQAAFAHRGDLTNVEILIMAAFAYIGLKITHLAWDIFAKRFSVKKFIVPLLIFIIILPFSIYSMTILQKITKEESNNMVLNENSISVFAKANNDVRQEDLNFLISDIQLYKKAHNNTLPPQITSTPEEIAKDGADICEVLIPTYTGNLPRDPRKRDDTNNQYSAGGYITDCNSNYHTGFTIVKDSKNNVTISAPLTEQASPLSVTLNSLNNTSHVAH